MSYQIRTALGRMVNDDDWHEFHKDTILRLLMDVAHSPLNPRQVALSIQSLCDSTGLKKKNVLSVCRALAKTGVIKRARNGSYQFPLGQKATLLSRIVDLEMRVAALEDDR